MSKPVTNVEIEDVLSSIRRLVSSSDREERSQAESAGDDAGKLVLTPSLRVDDVVNASESSEEILEDQELAEESGVDEDSLDEAVLQWGQGDDAPENNPAADDSLPGSDMQAAEAEQAQEEDHEEIAEVEDEGVDEAPDAAAALDEILRQNTDNSLEFEPKTALEYASDDADQDGIGDAAPADEEAADDTAELEDNLRQRAAEFETVVAESDEQWEPDGTTEDDNAGTRVGPVPWDDDEGADGSRPEIAAEADADDAALLGAIFRRSAGNISEDARATEDPVSGEDYSADAAKSDVSSVSSDPEEKPGGQSDEVELNAMMAELAQGVANADQPDEPVGETRSESAAPERTFAAAEPRTPDAGPSLAMDETLLDEDALRDLVSDIVRQELQGALGERITRNVRKLVRREIHRALASQEFE